MATNYPGSLDSFDTIASDKKTSDTVGGRTHRQMHNDLGDAIEAVQARVGISGTGAPEGVVTATPGTIYLQTDATTDVKGWLRWVKAGGTGNTGWVAGAEADTGWRVLTLEGDWTGTAYMVRVGRRVTFKFYNLTGTPGSAAFTLPTGFRLGTPGVGSATQLAATGSTAGILAISSTAGTSKVEPLGGARGYTGTFLEVSWVTNDDWPTSLPGSAA